MFDAFTSTHKAGDNTDDHVVIGLAHSRPGGDRNLRELNLLDSYAVSTFFRDAEPNCEPSSVQVHLLLEDQPFVAWSRVIRLSRTTVPPLTKISEPQSSPYLSFFFCLNQQRGHLLKLTLFRRRGDTLCGRAQA